MECFADKVHQGHYINYKYVKAYHKDASAPIELGNEVLLGSGRTTCVNR